MNQQRDANQNYNEIFTSYLQQWLLEEGGESAGKYMKEPEPLYSIHKGNHYGDSSKN